MFVIKFRNFSPIVKFVQFVWNIYSRKCKCWPNGRPGCSQQLASGTFRHFKRREVENNVIFIAKAHNELCAFYMEKMRLTEENSEASWMGEAGCQQAVVSIQLWFHCFTLSLKPTFSENLILHLSLFLSVGLISWL